ncbi:MAG: hypothetical protein GWO10_29790 [candidate division Zixibacteria bacterium]|nr:hypothetical protein [candidate division Zixibacteria bacterium]
MRNQKIVIWPVCLIFLFGLFFVGNGAVLCIGDDGHIEFETFCIPGCDEANEISEIDFFIGLQSEHIDCSNCTDIDLDSPLWSRRDQNHISENSADAAAMLMPDADLVSFSTQADSHKIRTIKLAYNQNPSSYSIISTILLC